MIATDLSTQKALDPDPKATQQINFTGDLSWDGNANTTMIFIIEEMKLDWIETKLYFSNKTVKLLWLSFILR